MEKFFKYESEKRNGENLQKYSIEIRNYHPLILVAAVALLVVLWIFKGDLLGLAKQFVDNQLLD